MKRIKFFALGFAALAGVILMNSCKDEAKKAPTVSLIAEAGYISADKTVAPGDSVKIKVNIAKGDGSLSSIDFSRDQVSLTGYPKTESLEEGNQIFATVAPANLGVYAYAITVKDKNDQVGTVSVKITVAAGAGLINTWTGKILGCGANTTTGSYLASSTGAVYMSADAKTNIAIVDVVYDNVSSVASLFSPSTSALTVSGKTITYFGTTTITGTAFDAMTDDTEIAALAAPTALKVDNIANGSVYVFKNAAGKMGLIKVTTSPTAGTTGTVTIDVKVQK